MNPVDPNSQWWYMAGARREGPLADAQMRDVVARGLVTQDTLVWTHGMAEWLPASDAGLLVRFAPPLPPAPPPRSTPADPQHRVEQLPRAPGAPPGPDIGPLGGPRAGRTPPVPTWGPPASEVRAASPVAPAAVYLPAPGPLPVAAAADVSALPRLALAARVLLVSGCVLTTVDLGVPVLLGALACFLVILHRVWSLVPEHAPPRLTPGTAVGFLFVPVVNCWWVFLAVHGLARALNAKGASSPRPVPRVSEAMAMSLSVLSVASVLRWLVADPHSQAHLVGLLASLTSLALVILVWDEFVRAALAIASATTSRSGPAGGGAAR